MRILIILLIIFFCKSNYATENTEILLKNKIYDLVKSQYFKDRKNNSKIYYSINEKKSLAACLDWNELTDYFIKNRDKYYKQIIWGSSYGDNSSKNTSIQNCQSRAKNKKSCICQIVDNQNSNAIVLPDYVFNQLNIEPNNQKKKQNEVVVLNNNQDEKLFKLKKLYDEGLITEEDYINKKNDILGLEVKIKKTITNDLEITNDTEGPVIEVAKSFKSDEDLLALIDGSVYDDSEVALIVIDGDPVSLINGKFSQQLFVKPGGQNINITAMDKFGNKTSTEVELVRAEIKIKRKIFDDLNPTLIKSAIDSSAVAIIIGIEDYQNTFSAPFAKNDALAFYDFANFSLGVPRENIQLLTNEDAERTNTLKTLVKWLPKMVKEDETDVYIFYSGHGLASDDGEELYLLPSDGDPELLEDSTLLRNQLFNRVAKLNPRSVTVFLDTCYSGATRADEFLVAAKPIFIEAQEQDIPANFTVFSASAGKETAKVLEEVEHGLFSYYMMKGLEGEADANSDNQITNRELIAFINKNVSKQANQTPQLNGNPDRVLVQW
tara:strand:- start:1581 stop:3230 length:1650 start_codon:yes stop_codon:yes gene_type:complete